MFALASNGRSLLLVVVIAVLLSGCMGGRAAAPVREIPKAEFSDETGGIEGFVVTDERVPIIGAEVQLIGLNKTVVTSSSGGFAFDDLEPQQYIILAQHAAFLKKQMPVNVPTGAATKVLVELEAIPPPVQYIDTGYVHNGQLAVGACAATVCHNGSPSTLVPEPVRSTNIEQIVLAADNWQTVLFELTWESSTAVSDQLRLALQISEKAQPSGSCNLVWQVWEENAGRDPLQVRLERADFDAKAAQDNTICPLAKGKKVQFTVSSYAADPPASGYVEQAFTVLGTISYNEPLPAGYTRLAEAPQ